MRYISVILPVPLRKTFTYHIEDDTTTILVGCRVVVHFGGQRYLTGIIADNSVEKPTEYETKAIESILDITPIVNATDLKLWQWIADYYMCSIGDVMKAALPSGLRIENKTKASLNEEHSPQVLLKGNEAKVYHLLSDGKPMEVSQIAKQLGIKNTVPLLRRLCEKKIINLEDETRQKYQPKLVVYFSLHPNLQDEDTLKEAFNTSKNAPKQLHFLDLIIEKSEEQKTFPKTDFLHQNSISTAIYNAVLKKHYIIEEIKEVSRFDLYPHPLEAIKPLSEEQEQCLSDIKKGFTNNRPMLLHGVTASGKTEVYIHLIKEQLDQGKQVLFLLPEIAITAEMLQRLSLVFGDRISIYHSRYSNIKRAEVWQLISSGTEGHLVLGARSAVLLPFRNLGLIIVDEEHETSYKQQEPVPHYHARDVAVVLSKLHHAQVILGSATPSIDSAYNAQCGKYGITYLLKRYSQVALPQFTVINMAEAYRTKQTKYHFSLQLIESINETLKDGRQVILFQNRRGYSGSVECQTCGYTPQCKHCDISLSYHRFQNALKCHYCGYTEPLPKVCPQCHSEGFDTKGMGTEKILEQAIELFPQAHIERFDQDTVKGNNNYETIINRFSSQRTNILIGTQMIAKGLDFKNVGLVAIMNADNMMNFPHYRSHERAYQLMSQVAGRAGRRAQQGHVILQSYTPDYQLIKTVTSYDYSTYYQQQISEREEFNYPPFVKLINITIKHKERHIAAAAAQIYADKLREKFGLMVLGPEQPSINRIKLQYLQTILLKIDHQFPLQASKDWLLALYDALKKSDTYKAISIHFEVDI